MDHRNNVSRPDIVTETEPPQRYVAYYRVSTGQQGRFGFSIEAQRAAVEDYVAALRATSSPSFPKSLAGGRMAQFVNRPITADIFDWVAPSPASAA